MELNRVGDTVALRKFADESVLAADRLLDGIDSVGRGGKVAGVFQQEHGHIVQVVPGRKRFLGRNAQAPGDFCECRAFVVTDVGEPGINVIAHDLEVGNLAAVVFHVGVDRVGGRVVFRDQTERGIGVLIDGGLETGIDPAYETRQVAANTLKKFLVGAMTFEVPFVKTQILGVAVAVNFPLDQYEIIGLYDYMRARQGLHETGHIAAGIDDPFGSARLQIAEELLQARRDGRILELGEQRAVEIRGNEFDRRIHLAWLLAVGVSGASRRCLRPLQWCDTLGCQSLNVIMPTAQEEYDDAMYDFSTADYDSAILKLKALLANDPNYFDAQLSLGMAYYRKGDYAAAIAEGHKAEKQRPNEQLVHTNLSLFYMKSGDKQTAEHHGLQARISSWRTDAQQTKTSPAPTADPELELARPKPQPMKLPSKFPDMPWKKKPAGPENPHQH